MSSSVTATWRKQKMSRSADLVIKNARILLESGIVRGGIGVCGEKICIIATDEHLPKADNVIDADGKLLMPGLIDGHAHIHDSAMDDHEDFTSGTRAAAAGGVTTVIDLPLTSQIENVQSAQEKINKGNEMAIVDFSLYGGMLTGENISQIPKLIDSGIAAFKAFTCEPFYANSGVRAKALSEVSEHGGHVTIHSEDKGVIDEFSKDFENDWDAPISHALSRPNLAESLAIRQNIGIASQTGGHLHIAHITTREGVQELEKGKRNGTLVTTEVCPHHLMFHRDDMNRLGPKSKMNPPLRSKEDKAAIWSALLRGVIDIAVSDHAPSPVEKKEAGKDDIREAWSGVDGIQMILRVLLSEGINKGRLSYSRLLDVTSRNPAKIFGLYPKKGVIRVGADADLVLIDPTKEEKITADMMFSKSGWTLYEGMTMKGVPLMTFVRGRQVFKGDRLMVKAGQGIFQPMSGSSKGSFEE
ncbi:MAG: dihydroorotase [Candidatus Thorarchaeota archaeon]